MEVVSLLLGALTVCFAFLSWRSAAIVPIEERESLLHQRLGDMNPSGGKQTRGDYHQFRYHSVTVRPQRGNWNTVRKYLTGTPQGWTEIQIVFESEPLPSRSTIVSHPWMDQLKINPAKVGPGADDEHGVMALVVRSVDPDEIRDQLTYFQAAIDHSIVKENSGAWPEFPTTPNQTSAKEIQLDPALEDSEE